MRKELAPSLLRMNLRDTYIRTTWPTSDAIHSQYQIQNPNWW